MPAWQARILQVGRVVSPFTFGEPLESQDRSLGSGTARSVAHGDDQALSAGLCSLGATYRTPLGWPRSSTNPATGVSRRLWPALGASGRTMRVQRCLASHNARFLRNGARTLGPSGRIVAVTVVVTGASSGIGRACALLLAEKHRRGLLLCGRDQERLLPVAARCSSLSGTASSTVVGDLRDSECLARLEVEAARTRPIAAIVHAAGVGRFAAVEELGTEARETIEINLLTPMRVTAQLLPHMQGKDRPPSIVFISSDADQIGFPEATAYCASKAGLRGFCRALSIELQPRGIRVCVISPGRVQRTGRSGRYNGRYRRTLEPSASTGGDP